jgi:hypothetical protein
MTSLRIIWAALLLGQFAFLGLILSGLIPQQGHPQPIFGYVDLAMLATLVPIMFLIRTFILGRARADGIFSPRAFLGANIVFWAGCESVCFASLVFVIVGGWNGPIIVCVGASLALQILTFPRSPGGY